MMINSNDRKRLICEENDIILMPISGCAATEDTPNMDDFWGIDGSCQPWYVKKLVEEENEKGFGYIQD